RSPRGDPPDPRDRRQRSGARGREARDGGVVRALARIAPAAPEPVPDAVALQIAGRLLGKVRRSGDGGHERSDPGGRAQVPRAGSTAACRGRRSGTRTGAGEEAGPGGNLRYERRESRVSITAAAGETKV